MATVNYPGAVERTQKLKNGDNPCILDWNAVTGKGTNDDTTELNEMLQQAPRGGRAQLAKGVYVHTGDLVLRSKPITLYGDGYSLPLNWAARFAVTPPTPEDIGNLGSVLWNSGADQHFKPGTPTSQSITGDGVLRTWTLDNKANYITNATVNGTPVTIGLDGGTGDNFYLGADRLTITQDAGGVTLTGSQVLIINYGAALNDLQITFRDVCFYGGSGVIQVPNLNTNIEFQCKSIFTMYCTGAAFELGVDETGNSQFFKFRDSTFYNNGVGILQHANCDLDVDKCVFYDQSVRSIDLRGANAKVMNSIFWGNTSGGGATGGNTNEDIRIWPTSDNPLSGATYNIKLSGNKFGNEDSVVGETRVKIRVGTSAQKAAHPDYYVAGLDISHNTFIGTYPGANRATGPTACIALHSPLLSSAITFNDFTNAAFAVDDSDAAESSVGGNNIYRGNRHFNGVTPFKSGGLSFCEIGGNDFGVATRAQPTEPLPIENLIAYSENMSTPNWASFHVTVTTGQADRLGGTGACKLDKDGTAAAVITIGFTASRTGPLMVSVWLKAGTAENAMVELSNNGATVIYERQYFGLDAEWRLYTLRLGHAIVGDIRNIRIYPGIPSETVACYIYAFGAQANSGNEVSGYLSTNGAIVSGGNPGGQRIPGDLSLGGVVLGNLRLLSPSVALVLLQTLAGTGFILALNNDGTLRIQKTADGGATITNTPILLDASGNLLIQVGTVHVDVWTASKPLFSGSGKNAETGDIDLAGSYITGNLGVSHLGSGSGASGSTFWRGDASWAPFATTGISTSGTFVTSVSFTTDTISFVTSVDFVTPDYTTANKVVVDDVIVTDVPVTFTNGLWTA